MVNKVCFSRLNDLVVELQYQASSLFSGVSLRKTGNGLIPVMYALVSSLHLFIG